MSRPGGRSHNEFMALEEDVRIVAHVSAGAEAGPTFSGAIDAEEMVFVGPGSVPAGLE